MRLGQLERRVLAAVLNAMEGVELSPVVPGSPAPRRTRYTRREKVPVDKVGTPNRIRSTTELSEELALLLQGKRRRRAAAVLDVRDQVYGLGRVPPPQRAAFSRALKSLEEKELVKRSGDHRFFVELTPESEKKLNANKNRTPIFVNIKQEAAP